MEDEEFPDDLSSRAGHDIFDSDAEDDHQMFLNESQKNLEKAACIVWSFFVFKTGVILHITYIIFYLKIKDGQFLPQNAVKLTHPVVKKNK